MLLLGKRPFLLLVGIILVTHLKFIQTEFLIVAVLVIQTMMILIAYAMNVIWRPVNQIKTIAF